MAHLPNPAAALDLTVGDLLTRWPEAARAFWDHRMACVGCQFSAFDTLREALAVHQVLALEFFESMDRISPSGAPAPADASHDQGEGS